MVKGNGFARHKVTCTSPVPPVPPKDSGRFMFMIRTVLTTALFILCGQTVFSQCALVCNSSLTVALDTAGSATLTSSMLLQSSVNCSNNFIVSVADTAGNIYGPTLGPSLLGEPLTATLLHPSSGNSCNIQIHLIDNLPPVLDCGDTLFIWCNTPVHPDSLGYPFVSDNATDSVDIEMGYFEQFTDLPCHDTIGGVEVTAYIRRTWLATDGSGNMSMCVQHIFLRRATLSQVIFPKHLDGNVLPALECGADDPKDLSITGQPMIEGHILDNTTNCDLVVSYNDQQVPICGGARKLIRTWSVFDLCTEQFTVYAQIIRLLDTTPPVLTCPPNVTVSTFNTTCTAQVWLPQATAEDGCSGATVQANWQFGSGLGPFNNVPRGSYTVHYAATDGCNNSSTCQITVTVKDEKKPTALCESLVNVNLEEDGTVIVFAQTFDKGSHDNCGISQYLVSLNDGPFDDFVSFDCADIGPNIPVTLMVVDDSGLSSQCVAYAKVKDPIQPGILCPSAVTIGCGQDFNNTALTGLPFATDNCGSATVSFTNQVNLNYCGNGTVLRTWKATDLSGNTATCHQVITVADNTPITVVFPEDQLYFECQPNTDPAVTGEPIITGKDCEQLQITHTDYFFYTAEPACFKLIRNWAVIDWCTYQPNAPGGAGFWEHTQVIEVRDTVAPVLTCPANMSVGITGQGGCQTFAAVPLPNVDDCSGQVHITNNSFFAQNNIGPASGTYPRGVHTITYTASDGCGNTSSCTMKLTVTDTHAPVPVCNNGVSVTIQQTGYVTVTPAMINNGSYDNCSPVSALVLQVSPNTFDCQSLGSKTVTLTVTDEAGNSAFCQTTVVVQDNFNICTGQNTANIAGKLGREDGVPLFQKLVGLSGGISIAVHTDVDGTFAFPNLPMGQSYTLTPTYNTKPLNGVTTYDLVIIRRHILNIEKLGSPYKMIAADVNKSGAVTTLDMVDIQKLILQVTTSFPNGNTSWRFVPASHVFPDPTNPFAQPFPENIYIETLNVNYWGQDFIGIKVGDVNNSANPANFDDGGSEDRSFGNSLVFSTKDIELVAGEVYAIPFVANPDTELAGFQFTIDFDENALAFEGIEEGASPLKRSDFGLPDLVGAGAVTVSWGNFEGKTWCREEAMFTLLFRAKSHARLSDVLSINSRITPAEAYGGNFFAPAGSGFEMLGVALQFEGDITNDFLLFQNNPNPFRHRTNVGFQLPTAAQVNMRIYDLHGKLVKIYEGHFPQGSHIVEINLSDAPHTGILFCEMEVPGYGKQVIKMMKL